MQTDHESKSNYSLLSSRVRDRSQMRQDVLKIVATLYDACFSDFSIPKAIGTNDHSGLLDVFKILQP